MATIKSFTDISQSKTLSKILPIESADMHYNNASIKGINYVDEHRAELMEYNRAIKVLSKYTINPLFEVIPCWSLAALLKIIGHYTLQTVSKDKKVFIVSEENYPISSDDYSEPVDACYEMIIKLNELKML